MQFGGFHPNRVTFACVLIACGKIGASNKVQGIHTQLAQEHSVKKHTAIASVVVDTHAKYSAREMFDGLQCQDLASWNALIAGYAQHGYGKEALDCFERMQLAGFSPDAVTFIGILKACSSIGAVDKGQEIHAQIVRKRLLEQHIEVANALVDMYAKCDAVEKAQDVFEDLPVRNISSWTALISGYVERGHGEEALACFEQMQVGGFYSDGVIFAWILKACGSIGAAHKGQEIHANIVRHGWTDTDTVSMALLVMYTDCGMLVEAQAVFDKLLVHDVVAWTVLMVGYARLERDEAVLELYDKMLGEGLQPDWVTLAVVLGSCSRSCVVDRSLVYSEIVSKGCGIIPTVEQYESVVDLLTCPGRLDTLAALMGPRQEQNAGIFNTF